MRYIKCLLLFILIQLPQLVSGQESDLVIIGTSSPSNSGDPVVTGYIKDGNTGEAIIGATIIVKEDSRFNTATDSRGAFVLNLPKGTYQITVSFIGYTSYERSWRVDGSGEITFTLAIDNVQLDQVVIKGESSRDNIERNTTGLEVVSIEELQQTAKLMGEIDVIRSIQSFSGVSSAGDGASGFNVRGGNADENLILQDQALILNPAHTLGFFSLFHPDLISTVNLYKGDQPSYLGGRLSSVLDVKLREGDLNNFKGSGGIGMVTSRLALEGPIISDKASFIVGGRISYMDWVLNSIKNIDVQRSNAQFYDLTAKVDYRLREGTKWGATYFISGDDFKFADEVNFEYQTNTLSTYLNHLISDSWNLQLTMNVGNYTSSLFDIQGSDISKFTNEVSYIRPNLRNFIQLNDQFSTTFGVDGNLFVIKPGSISPESDESTAVPRSLTEEQAHVWTPYVQLDWEPVQKLSISAGLRYNLYRAIGAAEVAVYEENAPLIERNVVNTLSFADGETVASYAGLEPRISMRYSLNDNQSIKASANRSFQYLNQISNTASSTPIDIWQVANYHIEPQAAYNFALGYYQNAADDKITFSTLGFYRIQPDIIEYRDFADLLLNEFLERELVSGEGKAYGAEFNIERKGNSSTLSLNYTFSRSFRKVVETASQNAINDGNWFPSNFDKPHTLNLKWNKKLTEKSTFNLNFTYSTGRPLTAPVSSFQVDNVKNIPIYSDRNEFRIPAYHRLDISYEMGPYGADDGGWESTVVFSVFNLYGRDNAYSVFFRQQPFGKVEALRVATLGAAFPSLTLNFKF